MGYKVENRSKIAVAADTPVDLEIWELIHTPPVCDVTVTHDESTVGLVERN